MLQLILNFIESLLLWLLGWLLPQRFAPRHSVLDPQIPKKAREAADGAPLDDGTRAARRAFSVADPVRRGSLQAGASRDQARGRLRRLRRLQCHDHRNTRAHARPPVAFGEITKDRRAGPLR